MLRQTSMQCPGKVIANPLVRRHASGRQLRLVAGAEVKGKCCVSADAKEGARCFSQTNSFGGYAERRCKGGPIQFDRSIQWRPAEQSWKVLCASEWECADSYDCVMLRSQIEVEVVMS